MIKIFISISFFFLTINPNDLRGFENNQSTQEYDLLSNIEDFVDVPQGGTNWRVFGETGMNEYSFEDKDGNEWLGLRPEFKDKLKKLEKKKNINKGIYVSLGTE